MKTKAMAAATMATAATAAPIDGLSREQAARFLRVSERQIQRLASTGQIQKTVLPKAPGEKTAPVIYARADLERLKRGEIEAKPATVGGSSKAQTFIEAGAAGGLLTRLSTAPALPFPSFVSIPEAAKEMRLPAWFIRARAPELVRYGVAVNVGRGKKPRWRLLRSQITGVLIAGV